MRITRALLATLVAAGTLLAGGSIAAAAARVAPAARLVPAAAQVAATATPYCGITWGSADKSGGALATAPLIEVRAGQQDCYDRLVFEIDGPANGYRVRYGEAYTQGQGLALSPYTAGGAVLEVTLLDPVADPNTGTVRYPASTGAHPLNLLGYQTLRDVVYGGSSEGYTTFAVGVRDRLPFRVTVLTGPGTHSRIVLDVAHRWQ
ncbi:hypothetical protein ACFFWC_28425 [Plantactinospora siamensis]|uniref:AMIN-like domain-containing protein n=1 Tax=Plantactinospora siamensis TaxID=555372 RepID=A0ABV6NV10_9ACTN